MEKVIVKKFGTGLHVIVPKEIFKEGDEIYVSAQQDALELTPEHREQLSRVSPNLTDALNTVLMFFYNRTDLNQARLSELQKKEVTLLIQEELYKARNNY